MAEVKLGRRNFLKGAGAAGAAGAAMATGLAGCSPEAATAAAPAAEPEVWHTLNATEAAFIMAAVDTLIPADELTPVGYAMSGLPCSSTASSPAPSATARGSTARGRSCPANPSTAISWR